LPFPVPPLLPLPKLPPDRSLTLLSAQSPYIKTVRGLGLLNAVVIDEDACNATRAARGQDVAGNKRRTAWQFCLLLKARGVLAKTTHGNV
jgi:ornithine--oxo-acid transaminase